MPLTLKDLKHLAFKPVRAAVNRIDFVRFISWLAEYEPGRSFVRRETATPPAFPDQEEIIQHTIELALADLADRNEKAARREIEDYARSISCRYDYDLHVRAKAGVFNLLTHLFEFPELDRIFLSRDRRELKHFETLRRAREEGLGVVYLVNHSSHWDEFIVALVLEQLGIQLPLFAAGSNMMATPSLERILMVGSYVIIRKGATKTYLSTLYNYCRALSEMGKQQGIFLEAWAGGARTRDGSLRYPRRLVSLQGALASAKDVLIQPLVLSYNVVPEDLGLSERAGFLSWLNGLGLFRRLVRSPHRPVKTVLAAFKGLFSRGYISFCQPRLLSELKEMHGKDPAEMNLDEFVSLYSMREIARDKKIMSSQLTACGLLRARGEASDDLVAATQAELAEVVEFHRRTFHQDPDLEDFIRDNRIEDVIEDGLSVLGRRKIISRPGFWSGRLKVLAEHGLQYYATHGDRRLYSPSAKENIVVLGAGAWGFGLTCAIGRRLLADKKYQNSSLMLYDSREDLIASIIDTRTHLRHFPKIRLPKNAFPTSDALAAFRKANEVLVSSPVVFFEAEARRVLTEALQPVNLIIATRGFEQITHRLPIQIAREIVDELARGDVNLLVLSGPVTPQALAEGGGASLVLAGPRPTAQWLADLFNLPGFDLFICEDPVGVQVAGVMSEVYSLLGSYLIRTKQMNGRNEIAAFLRETSEETLRLALALGGRKETFLPDNPAWAAEYAAAGLGGPGAAFGRKAGRSLSSAKAQAMDFVLHSPRELREEAQHLIGYTGIRSAYLVAKSLNVNVPRLRQAYGIFWRDKGREADL
ncbi:MAG: 1-acyl-sn-glycerol-3-phosphate acyltransferase [Thermodesulfobacteriota bacterium]